MYAHVQNTVIVIFFYFLIYKQYAQIFTGKKSQFADKRYVEHSITYSLYLG